MRNRQVTVKKRIFVSVFAMVACLFFFACGIPVYYVIEPPQSEYLPDSDAIEPDRRYFGIICPYSSSSDNSDITLMGTAIYYKIYNSREDMNSDISSISGRNTEYSEDGYRRMTDLGYQAMGCDTGASPIIKKVQSTRTIEVWLCDEGTNPVGIYNATADPKTKLSIPYRTGVGSSGSGNMSFNFTSSYHPEEGDTDYKYSSSPTNEGDWYINLYAVTVGIDISQSQQYSSLLHMGNLTLSQQ